MGATSKRYPTEFRERAVRLVAEQQGQGDSQWKALGSVSSKLGCTREALRRWVRQAERDRGARAGLSTAERERLKELERENKQLRDVVTKKAIQTELLEQALDIERKKRPTGPARWRR